MTDYIEKIRREITYIVPRHQEDDDWRHEGLALLAAGRVDRAELKFKELMLSQPEHSDGYEGLALTYEKLGHLEKAAFFIDEAIRRAQVFLDDGTMDSEIMDDMGAAQRRIELKLRVGDDSSRRAVERSTAGHEGGSAARPRLADVVDEMEMITSARDAYLNRATGEIVRLSDDEMSAAESGRDTSDLPDWEIELIEQAAEVLNSEDYVQLPTSYEIHEYSIMEDFCRSFPDALARDELLAAIGGRGAFRCFREAIHRLGVAEDWYRHRRVAIRGIAVAWLEANGIAFEDGDESEGRAP